MTLSIFPCEYLYMGYPTTVSQQIAGYGLSVAERAGCEAAVVENFDGVLTNVGDEPLFVVFGREVLTSPLACGATDSVMRRLIFGACRKRGCPPCAKSPSPAQCSGTATKRSPPRCRASSASTAMPANGIST
ncbi:MAG: hypothetical protein ACLTZY_09410 [Alistipes indistinctus]